MSYCTAIDTQFGQTAEIESLQELEVILAKKEQGSKAKAKEKFYRLKNDEWLSVAKKLTHSELVVLYHLRTLEPWGDKLTESSTKEVAEATGISQRSVQRALIKLAELELIDLQIQKFAFRLRSKCATKMTNSDSAVASTTPVSPTRQECRVNVAGVASTSSLSDSSPESVTKSEFQTSKTYSDFNQTNQTLSEATRERNLIFWKKFDEPTRRQLSYFAYQVVIPKLPIRPTLPDAWISCHTEELFNQMMTDTEFQKKWGELSANSPTVEIQHDTSKVEPHDTVDW
ncbi:hypothetical protein QUB49_36230 [Microcoleus sp. AT9_B4]